MLVEKTKLNGVLKVYPPTVFEDFRGVYIETYNKALYEKAGIKENFIQDDISISRKNTIRGIHGDNKTTKLVSCLLGEFYLIVVNNNPQSKQYMEWESFFLSEKNNFQILIPPFFGNGHMALSKKTIFHYKQTTEYNRDGQFTILWNDPKYKFWWPNLKPLLSKRDGGFDE